jgi:creatinine amidohydrolase/Fe(II)-dependent formamide hydrolase-like protein
VGETAMNPVTAGPAPLTVSRLTFPEIEKEIARLPVIILPLGGCEPYASFGTLGITSAVAESLGQALSRQLSVLCAPGLRLGCSTSFMSFGGTAGVKPRTFANTLCESIRMWYFQGAKAVFVIDALADNHTAVDLAVRRLADSHPECSTTVFSLQRDERVRAFIAQNKPGMELYRAEYGMLSMAAWLDPALVRNPADGPSKPWNATSGHFRTWRKRGADPEQFRKLAPGCSCSEIAAFYHAGFGNELFEFILGLLKETVVQVIQTYGK